MTFFHFLEVKFIYDIKDVVVLFDGSYKNKIRNPKGTYCVIDWTSMKDLENLYIFLYKNSTIFLERKKKLFDEIIDLISKKQKYRKKQ
jgi:hypothetical protein